MNIADILNRLEKVTGSNGKYKARCPAHNDNTPSLSITQEGGKVLLHCFTGCTTEAIVAAMGLTMRDLFQGEVRYDDPPPEKKREIVAVYDYKDLDGNIIYSTVRYNPKDFRQRRPDPERPGEYIWNLKGITPILYNLPAVVKAVKEKQPVFVVEGEKDCESLGRLGYTATTCPLGAGKWKAEYSDTLKNACVYIIADNDTAGKAHGEFIAKSLVGKAAVIKMIDLSGIVGDKGDITDFIVNGGDITKLIAGTADFKPVNHNGGRLVCMADIEEREVEWLWKPYIPYRKITLFRGDPGLGKTYFALMVASIVSNGWAFPDKYGDTGFTPTAAGNVLFLTAEDDLEDTIKPRLRKAKADMSKIHSFTDYITFADPQFEDLLKECSPRLVIIDPLQAFLGEGIDMHRANEIRPIFSHVRHLAERYNCSFIMLEHLNKNPGGKAIYRGLGSMDITGAARSVLMFGCDPQNDANKGFIHAKSNLDRKGEIVGFSITEHGLEWNPNTTLTDDMILGHSTKSGRPSYEVDEAVEFLKEQLQGNFITADEIYKRAEAQGISKRTLQRAKKEAGVDTVQKDRKWYWIIK